MPKSKEKWKMTPEELELWLHYRKKCAVHKSKKDYNRKEKHKKSYDMQEQRNIRQFGRRLHLGCRGCEFESRYSDSAIMPK